jgi:hypothetical protein
MMPAAARVLLLAGLVALTTAAEGCRSAPPTPRPLRPALPRIPRDIPRFEIDSVSDSTVVFRVQEARWLRVGLSGFAVDPQQRDALVARLRITARDSVRATALIVSQVSRVTSQHFLLVSRPATPWYRSRSFWTGAALGVSMGAGGALVAR